MAFLRAAMYRSLKSFICSPVFVSLGVYFKTKQRRGQPWDGKIPPEPSFCPHGADKAVTIDLETIGLLFGLFLVIGGITHMGVIDAAAALLAKLGGGNVFLLYTVIVWASVLLSAFIDNIPYVATMLPVITGLAGALGIPPALLYFGLLSGATLGGNCTPIGASANIAGIGILRKAGYEVRTRDFVRIGIPFTLAAVIPAYIYFWLLYS